MITWVVQDNLGHRGETERISQAVIDSGAKLIPTKVIPFSDDLPDIPDDGPTVFYGATGWVTKIHNSKKWSPGTWYDDAAFRYDNYIDKWGYEMLNVGAEITTLGEFGKRNYKYNELFFIRPVKDLKEFVGEVIEFGHFAEWCDRISFGGFTLTRDCQIVVSSPKNIYKEYRTYIVNKKAVTASQYRKWNRLHIDSNVPHHITEYAKSLAELYSPAPIFVLDIAELDDGRLKIVEAGCMNSCGLYSADENKIVKNINNYIKEAYGY